MYHEMTIHGFTLDSLAHRPVVILKDSRDRNTVPIWLQEGLAKFLETRWRGPPGSAATPTGPDSPTTIT